MKTNIHSAFAVSVSVWLGALGVCGSLAHAEGINPPQLYQNVGTLANELEQIRQVMGKRLPRKRSFSLADVEPRQVYFQAQTLFRKCNSLAQEVAGISRRAPPPAPEQAISPDDVYALIDQARNELAYVKRALAIDQDAMVPKIERRRQPADVMHDIIEAGYVLNQLTDQHVDWPQIYDRVFQATTYVGGVLAEDERYPDLPPFQCCKMPQDVFDTLAAAMEAARPSAEQVSLKLIRIIPGEAAEGGASPSTVFDLTTTFVSDLAELTLRMSGEDIDGPSYDRPPRIFPSHVVQLAKVLEQQIVRLQESTLTQ